MNTYLFGEDILKSSICLKALLPISGTASKSIIRFELRQPHEPEPYHWQHQWKEDDDFINLSMAFNEGVFILRFTELCDFILDFGNRHISARPHETLDKTSVEHLLIDQVLPRFLAHEGKMLLHACIVNVHGRTVLFLGKSGWGKSTLAGLFYQAGHTVYSDDCALVYQQDSYWQALATYPSLRLYEDSIEQLFSDDPLLSPVSEYSEKQRIVLPIDSTQIVPPLHAIYFLSDPKLLPTDIAINKMRPSNTCIELIERSFRLDIGNHLQTKALMQSAAILTQNVPAYRLRYPHDFENNTCLLTFLIKHIQE